MPVVENLQPSVSINDLSLQQRMERLVRKEIAHIEAVLNVRHGTPEGLITSSCTDYRQSKVNIINGRYSIASILKVVISYLYKAVINFKPILRLK
jgi:hypothetical protein